MALVFQCAQCSRTYTARVATCQICGGACRELTSDDALRLAREPAPEAPLPEPTCPCCDGPRGANAIALQTWRLKDVSLVPMKRTFVVTTVPVPGVCDSCSGSLQRKRYLADVLCLLPLIVLFVVLVVTEAKFFLFLILGYLLYLARHLTYNWADVLLYGGDLEGKLGSAVPAGEPRLPTFPAGLWHGAVRLGFFPALFALVAVLLSTGVIPKPARAAGAPAEAAAAPTNADETKAVPRTAGPSFEVALIWVNAAHYNVVEIDEETQRQPALGRPKTAVESIDGHDAKVVRTYRSAPDVPRMRDFQVMTTPTLVANFLTTDADYLIADGLQISRRQAEAVMPKVTAPKAPPSAIKRNR